MGKIVQNSISYSGVSARNYTDLVDVLLAGSTRLTIRSASLHEDSTVNLFTSNYKVAPLDAVLSENEIVLTFKAQPIDIDVKVRVWDINGGGGGGGYEDGNDIYYPIAMPKMKNKLYREYDVSNIALALGKTLKVSEMADAVETLVEANGVTTYKGTRAVVLAEAEITQYRTL